MTKGNGCVWCFRTQGTGNKYCKYDVSQEYRILTFLAKRDSNQMQVDEEGRVESDEECLARRWVFSSCCEWHCSPGRGGKVRPSFGSLKGDESRPSEATTCTLQARRTEGAHTWITLTHTHNAAHHHVHYDIWIYSLALQQVSGKVSPWFLTSVLSADWRTTS